MATYVCLHQHVQSNRWRTHSTRPILSPRLYAGALSVPAAFLLIIITPTYSGCHRVYPVFLTAYQCMTPTHWIFIPLAKEVGTHNQTLNPSRLEISIGALGYYLITS
jgi:hypothetical protein